MFFKYFCFFKEFHKELNSTLQFNSFFYKPLISSPALSLALSTNSCTHSHILGKNLAICKSARLLQTSYILWKASALFIDPQWVVFNKPAEVWMALPFQDVGSKRHFLLLAKWHRTTLFQNPAQAVGSPACICDRKVDPSYPDIFALFVWWGQLISV